MKSETELIRLVRLSRQGNPCRRENDNKILFLCAPLKSIFLSSMTIAHPNEAPLGRLTSFSAASGAATFAGCSKLGFPPSVSLLLALLLGVIVYLIAAQVLSISNSLAYAQLLNQSIKFLYVQMHTTQNKPALPINVPVIDYVDATHFTLDQSPAVLIRFPNGVLVPYPPPELADSGYPEDYRSYDSIDEDDSADQHFCQEHEHEPPGLGDAEPPLPQRQQEEEEEEWTHFWAQ